MANRLVVAIHDGMEAVPKWLLDEIVDERWAISLRLMTETLPYSERVGDAEALAYLMTVSRRCPLPARFVNIFVHLADKVLKGRGRTLPAEWRRETLSEFEKEELEGLKRELYRIRGGDIVHPLLEMVKRIARTF